MNTRLTRDRDSLRSHLCPAIALVVMGVLLGLPQTSVAQSEEPPPAEAADSADTPTDSSPAPPPSAAPATTTDKADGAAPAANVPAPGTRAYDHKLRSLEERVVNLKERIFRSKTRLLLLKERILNDVIAEAKLSVLHVNDMGGSFLPVQVYYRLDGEDLKLLDNATGLLDTSEPIEILDGNVAPGNHNLTVEMVYRGDSGVFTYLKDYLFKLRANYTFYATKGKVTTVKSIGYLKGDITFDLTDRPSIKFNVSQQSYTKDAVRQGEAPAESDGGP